MGGVNSAKAFDAGYALGGIDILTGAYHFIFRDERFVLKTLRLDDGRPNRCVRTPYAKELGFSKYGYAALIEEVRQCAALEANDG